MQRLKMVRRLTRLIRARRPVRRSGLTLVLWAPHPAQGDFERALRALVSEGKIGALLYSERAMHRLTSDKLREQLAQAEAQRRPLIVLTGLLPETKVVPFAGSVRNVRQVLSRTNVQKVTVVLLVSPPDRLLEAMYVRRAEHGLAGSFEEHLAQYADVDLSYADFVNGLAGLPQVGAVVPIDWTSAEGSLATPLEQVLRVALGMTRPAVLERFDRPARVRGFASRRGVRVAQAMHGFVESDKERRLVRTMVRQNFPARRLKDLRYLNDDDRRRLRKRYRDDRRLLKSAGTS